MMSEIDLLRELVAAVERDVAPLLRRACDDLYIDDAERLEALGALLAKAWGQGPAAACTGRAVAEAVNSDLRIDDSAVGAALAEKVRPPVSIDDVLCGIAARAAATGVEIALHLSVPPDDVSREGGDPDGPLGRAIKLGYVEPTARYNGYWRLTPAGQAQLRA